MKRELPRLGGLKLDPLADGALPLLLLLFTAVGVHLAGSILTLLFGWPALPGRGLIALLVAAESYWFTTVFMIRDHDRPFALRAAEVCLMLFLCWLAVAVPAAGGLTAAFTQGPHLIEVWLGTPLLVAAWLEGQRFAALVAPLHPGGYAEAGEQLPTDDHAQALDALRRLLLGQVVVLALFAGVTGVGAGGPLLLAALALGALLVAARLKQAITWGLERVAPSPAVAGRWVSHGLTLMLLPLLLALLLPAGPRLPVERLLDWEPREMAPVEPPPVEVPDLSAPQIPWGEGGEPQPFRGILWLAPLLKWLALAAAVAVVLSFLAAAARQLSDRVGREQLKGVWQVLAAVAAWYAALWGALRELLGGVVRQAAAVPAEAVGALLAQGGAALSRYLPALGRAPAEPRAALRWYFSRVAKEAARKGLRRRPGETAAEFAARLAAAAPDQAAAVAELRDAYHVARYTDEPVGSEQVSFARRVWLQIARAIGRPKA